LPKPPIQTDRPDSIKRDGDNLMKCWWLQAAMAVAGLMISSSPVRAQELLTNGGLELVFPDVGGRDSEPPGWTLTEGPLVPEVPGPYRGDYNNGGVTNLPCNPDGCGAVDAADYVLWRDKLGQAFALPNRHPNLSGNINQFDYDVWRADFGNPLPLSMAEPGNFSHRLYEGDWHMWFQPYLGTEALQPDNYAHLTQTVPGSPGLNYKMTGAALFENYFPGGVVNLNAEVGGVATGAPFNDGPLSPTDSFLALDFLDAGGNTLAGSVEIELKAAGQLSNSLWQEHTLQAVAPAGTTNVRVRASMTDGVYNPLPSPQVFQMSFFVDAFSLTVVPGSSAGAVPEPMSWTLGVIALGTLGSLRRRRSAV
jgi:MYXO-CTERM domain-containing protein